MAQDSSIEWTDKTWNPVRGCFPISPGCANCYAMSVARRFNKPGQAYDGLAERRDGKDRWTGIVRTYENMLMQPLKWKKGVRIFVNSMSDLFHEDVPFEFIDKVFAVMAICSCHTFQILTKRPERMAEYFRRPDTLFNIQCEGEAIGDEFGWCHAGEDGWQLPFPNVWLGVSVENQEQSDKRIPELLKVPAAVRFLSCEPLLSAVEFSDVTKRSDAVRVLGQPALAGIHWLICGGESGSNARPMHPDWARSLRDQCQAASVPFFFKQAGEWEYMMEADAYGYEMGGEDSNYIRSMSSNVCVLEPSGKTYFPTSPLREFWAKSEWQSDVCGQETVVMHKVGKKAAGRLLDGREWNEFPNG